MNGKKAEKKAANSNYQNNSPKKLRKDKTPEIIAEELEEDEDTIRHLCAVAKNFAPDYNLEQIYNAIYKKDN